MQGEVTCCLGNHLVGRRGRLRVRLRLRLRLRLRVAPTTTTFLITGYRVDDEGWGPDYELRDRVRLRAAPTNHYLLLLPPPVPTPTN